MKPCRPAVIGLALFALMLCGCPPTRPEQFVSSDKLLSEYNANAAKVPRLWARARIRATLGRWPSWGSTSPLGPANGYVMLSKDPSGDAPAGAKLNFVLIGREVAGDLFRAGSDAETGLYYFWYNVDHARQAWFGRRELAGAPGVMSIPIDPLQLAEILGVTELPKPGAMPAAVMTLQEDPFAYVVRYLRPQPKTGQLKIWREVYFRWNDKRPRRPFRVKLFDSDGLCRVVADVGRYEPVLWDGPEDEAPVMPTEIRMTWPARELVRKARDSDGQAPGGGAPDKLVAQPASSIHIKLSEMSTVKDFSNRVFDFWSKLPATVTDRVQVDAAYGPIRRGSPGR